jgi:hypothetical protein
LKKHLNLTKHRPNSQLKETDLINRKCSFKDDVCWFTHEISTSEKQDLLNDDNFDCQTCDDRFETISGLMKNRKVEH